MGDPEKNLCTYNNFCFGVLACYTNFIVQISLYLADVIGMSCTGKKLLESEEQFYANNNKKRIFFAADRGKW